MALDKNASAGDTWKGDGQEPQVAVKPWPTLGTDHISLFTCLFAVGGFHCRFGVIHAVRISDRGEKVIYRIVLE